MRMRSRMRRRRRRRRNEDEEEEEEDVLPEARTKKMKREGKRERGNREDRECGWRRAKTRQREKLDLFSFIRVFLFFL
jgi:hypothetical protein